MKLGILETGRLAPELEARHGRYDLMFARLMESGGIDIAQEVYPVVDGVFPDAVYACDAWLVTGSKHGVYEDLPWIPPLKQFLQDAYAAEVPLIGVCFGHQIMAEALGGRAEKSPKGWGAGAHSYQASEDDPAWFGALPASALSLLAMHQDQVTVVPPDARVIATSDFCENAALAYGGDATPLAISVQPHPEFEARLVDDLVAMRAGDVIPNGVAQAAQDSLQNDVDSVLLARWMAAFLTASSKRRAAA